MNKILTRLKEFISLNEHEIMYQLAVYGDVFIKIDSITKQINLVLVEKEKK